MHRCVEGGATKSANLLEERQHAKCGFYTWTSTITPGISYFSAKSKQTLLTTTTIHFLLI